MDELRICLGYIKLASENALRICLCVSNVPFAYFKLRVHHENADSDKAKNSD